MFDDNPVVRSMLRHEVLGREAEETLLRRYAELAALHGADSREAIAVRGTLIEHNMKLVAMVAGRFKRIPTGMERGDLIAFGVFGLVTAIEKFDVSRGCRFSTYACWWVRHAIGRHLADEGGLVRVPIHAQDAARKSDSNDDESRAVADARNARSLLSLDAPIASGEEDSQRLGDRIAYDGVSVLNRMEHDQDVARVAAAVERLPERLRAVVCERMAGRLLRQVGDEMPEPRSRERVRQLEAEAHAMLRRELRSA